MVLTFVPLFSYIKNMIEALRTVAMANFEEIKSIIKENGLNFGIGIKEGCTHPIVHDECNQYYWAGMMKSCSDMKADMRCHTK